jgi:hypothetical protein
MVVNFRVRGISRGARKLTRIPTLNLKKKKKTGIESMTQSSSSSCLVSITLFSIPLSDFLPQSTLITVM